MRATEREIPIRPAAEAEATRLREGFVGSKLPDYMIEGVILYVCHGIVPGDFLTAMLSNDARRALDHADPPNAALLGPWFRWFARTLPGQCWGSREAFRTWVDAGGISGISAR